jgi:hypothetical protein
MLEIWRRDKKIKTNSFTIGLRKELIYKDIRRVKLKY